MTAAVVFFDAEAVLRDWLITLALEVDSLPGKPVKVILEQPGAKPPSLSNAFIALAAGIGDDRFAAEGAQLQTVNGQVWGPTRKAAADAAIAYAEALRSLQGGNVLVAGTSSRPAALLGLDFVTAPLWAPDRSVARYLVDATVILTAA